MRRWERPGVAGRRVWDVAARRRHDERGSQTIEWIGIAAVVAAIVVGIIGLAPDVGNAVADAFGTVIDEVIGGG